MGLFPTRGKPKMGGVLLISLLQNGHQLTKNMHPYASQQQKKSTKMHHRTHPQIEAPVGINKADLITGCQANVPTAAWAWRGICPANASTSKLPPFWAETSDPNASLCRPSRKALGFLASRAKACPIQRQTSPPQVRQPFRGT